MTELTTELADPGTPAHFPAGSDRGRPGRRAAIRIAQAVLTVWGASMAIFAILPLTGDPVHEYILDRGGDSPSPAAIARVRRLLGLDHSLIGQYLTWLGRAVRGNFGVSYQTGEPVRPALMSHLAATLMLVGVALAMTLVASLALGLVSARFVGHWPDTTIRVFSSFGVGVPDFVVGLVLLEVVVVHFGVGQVVSNGAFDQVWFPAASLALFPTAQFTQILRAGLVDAQASGYSLVAAARGSSRARVLFHHALPNALTPYLTMMAMEIGLLLGGTAVVESVFSWPGVGQWLVAAVLARDLPEIQAFALVATVVFVTLSLVVDLVVSCLDTRTQAHRR